MAKFIRRLPLLILFLFLPVLSRAQQPMSALGFTNQNTSDAAWTSSTPNNTRVPLLSNQTYYNAILVTLVQGTTITGGSVTFQESADNSNWEGVQCVNKTTTAIAGPTYVLVASTNVNFICPVNLPYFGVLLSPAITGTGTVTIGHNALSLPSVALMAGTETLAAGSNIIGSLLANQSVNVNQVAGAASGTTNPLYVAVADGANGPVAVKPPIGTTLTNSVPSFTTAGAQHADRGTVVVISPNSQVPATLQKTTGTGSGSQASLATSNFGSANTAGNSLVAVVGVGNSGAVKLSDTTGNPWTQDVCIPNSTTFQVCLFHSSNIKAGTNACTVTPSASVSLAIECYEVSGIIGYGGGGDPANNSTANQQGTLDVIASAIGTSTTPATGATAITHANSVAFAGIAIGTANQTPTAFNPWSKDADIVVGGTPSGLFGLHSFSQSLSDSGQGVSLTATITSEPWAAALGVYVPAHQTVDGSVSLATTASGSAGALRCTLVSAASTNATFCKANPGNVYGFRFVNTTATLYYLRMYNLTAQPTCSSATGFVESIPIPASTSGAGIVSIEPFGEYYSVGIAFCFTGGSASTDNTNAATGVFGTILYR